MELHRRTYFFRPSQGAGEMPVLNLTRLLANKAKGRETTILLDTNVLIAMERVVRNGNRQSLLKDHGLHNLVRFLNSSPTGNVCISPGRAFAEMPPAAAMRSELCYEAFCARHLPSFMNVPDCIHPKFSGKESNYGFQDLDGTAQAFLAVSFACLLYLHIIDKWFDDGPIQKFIEFMRRASQDLDVLSAKEIETAKYCLANPSADSRETIRLRRAFRKNFLKTKKDKAISTEDEALHVAFNGACDLALINVANVANAKGIDGVAQDVWIATNDKKLFEFSRVFQYLELGRVTGMVALASVLPEQMKDAYWVAANRVHRDLVKERFPSQHGPTGDVSALVAKARAAMSEVHRRYALA